MASDSEPNSSVDTEPLGSALSPTPVTLSKLGSAELEPFPRGCRDMGEGLWGPAGPLFSLQFCFGLLYTSGTMKCRKGAVAGEIFAKQLIVFHGSCCPLGG